MLAGTCPGDERERAALLAAVARACRCAPRLAGQLIELCEAHLLLSDEAALKRLIFYRRWHLALRRGEWLGRPAWNGPTERDNSIG